AIICGSGLSGLSSALDASDCLTVPYGEIPGFPSHCSVAGHRGELVLGTLSNSSSSSASSSSSRLSVICFRGRFHSYEGHSMQTVVLPVRLARCLGVKLVVVTNAAGGLKDSFRVGDVAVIRDHIALPLLAGKNPLVGPNDDELGPRFPPTSNLYDGALQEIAVAAAEDLGCGDFVKRDGTYAFVSGPQYESRSECGMLRMLGAHAVGMSTVPEVLAAHHAGMAVLCLSLITNKVVFLGDEEKEGHANHEEVLEAVEKRGEQMVRLVKEIILRCGRDYLPGLDELTPICLETKGRVRGELELNAVEEGEEGEDGQDFGKEENKSVTDNDVERCRGAKCVGKSSGVTLCPYHMVKNALTAPLHCVVMGSAILAMGAILGINAAKRR
ncbi:hypothetical protein ACHAXS_000179, partial [Conticribra weissflogii]